MFRPMKTKRGFFPTSFHNVTIQTSYAALVKLFGEPNSEGDQYKVYREWILQADNGDVATIYDWKEGLDPAQHPLHVISWHLGAVGHYGDPKPVAVTTRLMQQIALELGAPYRRPGTGGSSHKPGVL
jgi:hypothetical protein